MINQILNINFEYLDRNNGGSIQLYHTGKSNKDIELLGKIKGCEIEIETFRLAKIIDPLGFIVSMMSMIAIFVIYFLFIDPAKSTKIINSTGTYIIYKQMDSNILSIAPIMLASLIVPLLLIRITKYFTKRYSRYPKGLESFKDDLIERDERRITKSGIKLYSKYSKFFK